MRTLFFFFLTLSLPLLNVTGEEAPPVSSSCVSIKRDTITTIGTTYPKHASTLCCVVSGKVKEVLVDVGDRVHAGQPLLKLDPLFFKIDLEKHKAALKSVKAKLEDSELNYERMKKLWNRTDGKPPSISHKRLEDAALQYNQDLAQEQIEREALNKAEAMLEESCLKAPYDGVITKRSIHPGEAVLAEQPLGLEIEHLDTLYLEFTIAQTYKNALHIGQQFAFEVEGITKNRLAGTIDMIYPNVDEKTRAITCRATIVNKDHLILAGALVRVYLPLERNKP